MKKNFYIKLFPSISILLLSLFLTLPLNGKSFLWELDFNGTRSYLLGSVHMMKQSVFPLKSEIENAFLKSGYLVVEADISSEKRAEILKTTLENAKFSDNSLLKDHISSKTFDLVKKKMDSLGMSVEYFKTFRPWFVAMTITSMELVKMGFNPNFGIDKHFIDRAGNRKIIELEGIEYQMNLFNNFSDKENEGFLISAINEASSLEKNIDDMVKAWQSGDTELMQKLVDSNRSDYPEMEEIFKVIIEKRNVEMSKKIGTLVKEGKSCFVIVGAAHMIGKTGIVNLLREKGFKLKQI